MFNFIKNKIHQFKAKRTLKSLLRENNNPLTVDFLNYIFDETKVNFNLTSEEKSLLKEYIENMSEEDIYNVDFSALRNSSKGELRFLLICLNGDKGMHHADLAYQFIWDFNDKAYGIKASELRESLL